MGGVELSLDATPRSVPAARRWLRDALGPVPDVDVDIACLLLSELVTNALLHARTAMTVRLVDEGQQLRIEVVDQAVVATTARAAFAAMNGERGRGLAIVSMLAGDWGVDVDAGSGHTVWLTLPRLSPDRGTSAAADDDVSA